MKATIWIIAVVVASYLYDKGYPMTAVALVLTASWEAFIYDWLRAFRRRWLAGWSEFRRRFLADTKEDNRGDDQE